MILFLEQLLEQRKKTLYLLLILLVLFLLIWQVGSRGLLRRPPLEEEETARPQEVEIDFGLLESSSWEALQLLEQVPPLEGAAGRENPFLPY